MHAIKRCKLLIDVPKLEHERRNNVAVECSLFTFYTLLSWAYESIKLRTSNTSNLMITIISIIITTTATACYMFVPCVHCLRKFLSKKYFIFLAIRVKDSEWDRDSGKNKVQCCTQRLPVAKSVHIFVGNTIKIVKLFTALHTSCQHSVHTCETLWCTSFLFSDTSYGRYMEEERKRYSLLLFSSFSLFRREFSWFTLCRTKSLCLQVYMHYMLRVRFFLSPSFFPLWVALEALPTTPNSNAIGTEKRQF